VCVRARRDKIKGARLVANPGCYPTSVQLPLYPLLKDRLILKDDIIIDSKSGVRARAHGGRGWFADSGVWVGADKRRRAPRQGEQHARASRAWRRAPLQQHPHTRPHRRLVRARAQA
jgi:hypothetical protein